MAKINNDETQLTAPGGFGLPGDGNIIELMAEEFNGLDLSYERVKIPIGGGTAFELPGEDPDEPETITEFSGVILHHHIVLTHYKSDYTGGNNPPDCGSFDGVVGEGAPGGECAKCPLRKFGTGKNGSKACKDRRRLYILREGEIFPLLLSLPTGSLKSFTRYLKTQITKGRLAKQVVTRFALKKVLNAKGIAYSQAQFALDRVLDAEEQAQINTMSENIKKFAQTVGFDLDATVIEPDDDLSPYTEPDGDILPF